MKGSRNGFKNCACFRSQGVIACFVFHIRCLNAVYNQTQSGRIGVFEFKPDLTAFVSNRNVLIRIIHLSSLRWSENKLGISS